MERKYCLGKEKLDESSLVRRSSFLLSQVAITPENVLFALSKSKVRID